MLVRTVPLLERGFGLFDGLGCVEECQIYSSVLYLGSHENDVLLRDETGRILLVDPKYKPDWDLPGGMAEANEPPAQAAQRELREELGLDLRPGRLLCVDWVSPHGPWDDLIAFIFDGGQLGTDAISSLHLPGDELGAYELCDHSQAEQRLRPYVWRRVAAALEALPTGQAAYLHDGHAWPPPV